MSMSTPCLILEWFRDTIAEKLGWHKSIVVISAHDTSPEQIPPGNAFVVISPREMRFAVPEQNPEQCTVEWDVRVRVFTRLALDRPGSMDIALCAQDRGLYSFAEKILHAILTELPPEVPLRGCFAASITGPVEWLAPLEGQVSYLSMAIDFRADFDWVFG